MRLPQTGLAGIPIFRGDRPLDRYLEDPGIVEDDERRIGAEFERHLLHRAGALLHQQLADLGRSREDQLADDRVRDVALPISFSQPD